jgi:hypothetical protein
MPPAGRARFNLTSNSRTWLVLMWGLRPFGSNSSLATIRANSIWAAWSSGRLAIGISNQRLFTRVVMLDVLDHVFGLVVVLVERWAIIYGPSAPRSTDETDGPMPRWISLLSLPLVRCGTKTWAAVSFPA